MKSFFYNYQHISNINKGSVKIIKPVFNKNNTKIFKLDNINLLYSKIIDTPKGKLLFDSTNYNKIKIKDNGIIDIEEHNTSIVKRDFKYRRNPNIESMYYDNKTNTYYLVDVEAASTKFHDPSSCIKNILIVAKQFFRTYKIIDLKQHNKKLIASCNNELYYYHHHDNLFRYLCTITVIFKNVEYTISFPYKFSKYTKPEDHITEVRIFANILKCSDTDYYILYIDGETYKTPYNLLLRHIQFIFKKNKYKFVYNTNYLNENYISSDIKFVNIQLEIINPKWMKYYKISSTVFETLPIEIDVTSSDFINLTGYHLSRSYPCILYYMKGLNTDKIYQRFKGYVYRKDRSGLILYKHNDIFDSETNWDVKIDQIDCIDIYNSNDLYTIKPMFDTMNVFYYDKHINKYIILSRANIYRHSRYIQYTTSSDMKKWDKMKMINVSPEFDLFQSCYYTPNIYPYDDNTGYYLGFIPTFNFNTNEHKVDLLFGDSLDDLYRFSVFHSKTEINTDGLHDNQLLTFINGAQIVGNNIFFYYYNKDIGDTVNVVTFKKDRLFGLAINGFSNFILTPLTIYDNTVLINYTSISDDGYLKIKFNGTEEIYKGDGYYIPLKHINDDDTEIVLEIEAFNIILYSITGKCTKTINKYSNIRFYYLEYYKSTENNEKWLTKDITFDNKKAIEIIGDLIYENNNTCVKVNIKYEDDITRLITLVDTSNKPAPVWKLWDLGDTFKYLANKIPSYRNNYEFYNVLKNKLNELGKYKALAHAKNIKKFLKPIITPIFGKNFYVQDAFEQGTLPQHIDYGIPCKICNHRLI
jgi:hypothetical protein